MSVVGQTGEYLTLRSCHWQLNGSWKKINQLIGLEKRKQKVFEAGSRFQQRGDDLQRLQEAERLVAAVAPARRMALVSRLKCACSCTRSYILSHGIAHHLIGHGLRGHHGKHWHHRGLRVAVGLRELHLLLLLLALCRHLKLLLMLLTMRELRNMRSRMRLRLLTQRGRRDVRRMGRGRRLRSGHHLWSLSLAKALMSARWLR